MSKIEMPTVPHNLGHRVARATVFKSGVVKWGGCMEGSDSVGISFFSNPVKEEKGWRVSYRFDKKVRPLWWSDFHRLALEASIREKRFELFNAVNSEYPKLIMGNYMDMQK